MATEGSSHTHTHTHTHSLTHTHTHSHTQGSTQALITGFATGTVDLPAVVCVWACCKGICSGSEQHQDNWELVWKGVVQPRTKTQMRLEKPLLLMGGQERGFLM